MSRAPNGGWDFVKVGQTYQYKEDSWIAMITILEDNSNKKYYNFKVRIDKSSIDFTSDPDPLEISFIKELDGVFSGMSQIYENEEYICNYVWERGIINKVVKDG